MHLNNTVSTLLPQPLTRTPNTHPNYHHITTTNPKYTYTATNSPQYAYQRSVTSSTPKKVCNYIRQYFAVGEVFNIPEISIASFYEKIHKLRSILLEPHLNLFEFMQNNYPLQPLLSPTSHVSSQHPQLHAIHSIDTSKFSILQHPHQNTQSLYFGQLVDSRKQGYAVYAEYQLADTGKFNLQYFYEGFYHEDQKQGFGVQWNQHCIYIGNFTANHSISDQASVLLYQTGDIYVGSVSHSKKDGKGAYFKLKNKLNQYYKYQTSRKPLDYEYIVVGIWEGDEVSPKNDFFANNGIKQLLEMNLFNVEANLLIQDHSIYCGDLAQKIAVTAGREICFLRHGEGFQYFVNGDVYRGEYLENKPHGNGHYIWSSFEEYMGQFKEGLRSGNGRWVGSNGQQFEGQYRNDKRNGYGIYKWPNGDVYQGEFEQDVRNGLGRMCWHNGEKYVGQWRNGLQHGTGQIQIQLRSTSLHKKFLFDRGNPIIKKQFVPCQVQCQGLMKSKFQYKSKIKELNQHKRSFKKDESKVKSLQKEAQTIGKNSLGQLKLSKKLKLQQEKARRLNTQHKANLKIDRSFFQFRASSSNTETQQPRKKPLPNLEADKVFVNNQDAFKLAETEDITKTIKYEVIKLSKPMQTQMDLRRSITNEGIMTKKAVIKKNLLKERRKTEADLKMGETLFKPIRWVNFKQSWERV